jgi:hypothetical protein
MESPSTQYMLALLLSLIIFSSHAVCLLARAHAPANFLVRAVGACTSASNLASLIVLTALASLYGVKGVDATSCVCAMALHLSLLALWPYLSTVHTQEASLARNPFPTAHDPSNNPKAPPSHFSTPTRLSAAAANTYQHATSAPVAPAPSSPFNAALSNVAGWLMRKTTDYMPPMGSTTIYGAIIGGSNNTVNIGRPDSTTRASVGSPQQLAPHQAPAAPAQPPTTPPPVKVSFQREGLFNREPPVPPAAPPPPNGNDGSRGSGNGGNGASGGAGPTRPIATVYANSDASTVHLVPNTTSPGLPVGFVVVRKDAATSSAVESMYRRYTDLKSIMEAIQSFGAKAFNTPFLTRAAINTLGRNFCPAAAILLSLGLDDTSTFNMKIFFTAFIAMANVLLSLNDEQLFNFLSATRSYSTMGAGPSRPHFAATHMADREGRPFCDNIRRMLRGFITNYSFIMSCEDNFTKKGRAPAVEGDMDIFMLLLCACLHQINFGAVIFSSRNSNGTHNFTSHAALGSNAQPWASFICHTVGHFSATLPYKALFEWVRRGTYRPPDLTVLITKRLQAIADTPAIATTITNAILDRISKGHYKITTMSPPSTPADAQPITVSYSGSHISVADPSPASSLSASTSIFSPSSSASSDDESLGAPGLDEVREGETPAPLGPRRGRTAATPPRSAPAPSAAPTPAPAPEARGLNLGQDDATRLRPRPPSRARAPIRGSPPARGATPITSARAAPVDTPTRSSARISEAASRAASRGGARGGATNL